MAGPGFNHEWVGQTTLHPLGFTAVLVLGTALVMVPRKYAVLPMAVMACFVPPAQRIAVEALNFDLLRLMVLFGWTRLFLRGEIAGLRWNLVDTALVAWTVSGMIFYVCLWQSTAAVIYRLGIMYDAIGMYFLFRCLVRGPEDINMLARGFAVIAVPVSMAFIVEHFTARNMFAVLGGVPAITDIRDDRLRCQGAFAHPILAGCFWAALIPLMVAQWWQDAKGRMFAVMGVGGSLIIILLCSSATPVMAVLFAITGALFYPLRKNMRLVRWGLVLLTVGLHLSMKAPVWHLISRIDISSGTAYHRFLLIDGAIRNFDEWWVMGCKDTESWGFGLHDVTNQYVGEAVTGGLSTLVCFVATIAFAFGRAGRFVAQSERIPSRRILGWAVGVSMLVHTTNFIGVSYFGQINMLLSLQFAMMGSLPILSSQEIQARVRAIAAKRMAAQLATVPAAPTLPELPGGATPSGAGGGVS